MRALFFGSPAFAVPSLDQLHAMAEIAAVVCQPDKPSGRGLAVSAPPVKVRAVDLGLPIVQPTRLRAGEFEAWVRALHVDVALVVAYGRILPGGVLSGPRLGCVNVHASLLPKYRGAAPIAWAIVNGEIETGITLMKLDEGMDTGPTFARIVTPIGADETAAKLASRLSLLGADAVREWLPRYVAGECTLEPQDSALASMAPMLEKDHGRIDWSKRATQVHDHVRGMNPWPGAFTVSRGRLVKVGATRVLQGARQGATPGEVIVADKSRVLVACGEGCSELMIVQPEGRRAMSGSEWAMGRGVAEGDVLGA
ncbi:MAG: methionyl-tRNA formyltransferase [Myxococcota bacterium]|nr:methionyl-tRNA formyltransferase [Myxococcota bacterium]